MTDKRLETTDNRLETTDQRNSYPSVIGRLLSVIGHPKKKTLRGNGGFYKPNPPAYEKKNLYVVTVLKSVLRLL